MASATRNKKGTLLIIGGREDKVDEMLILREIAKRTGRRKMVIITLASAIPDEVFADYKSIFNKLGCKNVVQFHVDHHEEAMDPKHLETFKRAHTVFFSGGDQLKLTTKLGGTPVFRKIQEIYEKGGLIAGTSAGAAMMGKTMLVGGENSESHKVGNWMMAPGLGFVEDMIIDQHFAQRGRIGRLLGAIAMNPGILGVGIDEDTAILVDKKEFKVIGSNAVYVIDGRHISYTNISEASAEKTMSMHDVRLHILSRGEQFCLKSHKASVCD